MIKKIRRIRKIRKRKIIKRIPNQKEKDSPTVGNRRPNEKIKPEDRNIYV